ncbi:unnamed protein product [Schistosoma margrebowiei]|uniref:Uncharacterized protein n=1 Tax=Schistosoma margrebowiei TaxID=48269 RepID=A0A183N0W3_9TREM|nr:unnamed protein product [Schistosoma margrebowiei]
MNYENTPKYEDQWANFIQSLDVDPDKAKGIEQLPDDQKRQLLENYNPRKGDAQQAKEILLATEISLRTNNVA